MGMGKYWPWDALSAFVDLFVFEVLGTASLKKSVSFFGASLVEDAPCEDPTAGFGFGLGLGRGSGIAFDYEGKRDR